MSKQKGTRINRDAFLKRVKERLIAKQSDDGQETGNLFTVEEVGSAILDELVALLCDGYRVAITGFGSFVLQLHKGHPVQFGDTKGNVHDYHVLRFSPSNVLSKYIRERMDVSH